MADQIKIIAVTNRHLCKKPFLEQIRRVCEYHPDAIILREKDLTEDKYTALLEETAAICKKYQVRLIPHTYISSARKLGFTEIHLPLPALETAHAQIAKAGILHDTCLLDTFTTIGTSVHSVSDAVKAESLGASYLTAGHIYITDCKKGLEPRGLDFLREVCKNVHIPVYGIGGIKLDPQQLEEIARTGAAGGCIMSGMMNLAS